jgi:hypothetical protein
MSSLPSLSIDVLASARVSNGVLAQCNEATVAEAERRYKKFLALLAKYPDLELAPSRDIDEVWHLHMLNPRAYVTDCNAIFGDILDHDGGFGKNDEAEFQVLTGIFHWTAELWEREYGEPYVTHELHRMEKCIKACRKACKVKITH